MNILLWLAYKGTNYSGFQVQPNGVTVCAVVQDAMQSAVSYTHLGMTWACRTWIMSAISGKAAI